MAILWADDFSGYGDDTSKMLNGLYAEVTGCSIVDDPDPLATGKALRVNDLYINNASRVLPAAVTEAGLAARFYLSALPLSDYTTLMVFSDTSNRHNVQIACSATGTIRVYRGVTGSDFTLLGETTGPVITANAWNHVEALVRVDELDGSVEVRVNGTTVITLTGVDTVLSGALALIGRVTVTTVRLNIAGGYIGYIKDLVAYDTLGTHNNDFLGTVQVISLVPDSDVSLDWTPSTGTTGWNLINEDDPSDATYISAGDPAPSPALMTLTDLPTNVTSVRALITRIRAKKIDGGDGNIQTGMKSGTETDVGVDRPMTTTYTYWEDVFETDPDGDGSWTPASTNAAQIQFNRTV